MPWFDSSLAGKQNMALRADFEGSLDDPKPPFRINVEELSIANDFYTMKWPFALEVQANNDVIIRHHGMMKHTEAFDRVAQESVDALLAIVQDDELEVDDKLRARLKALDAKMLHGLMPALFPAGEIQTMANLNMNGEASTATIEEAGFTTALFGLTAKGSADVKQMKLDMQMVCHSCDALITSASAYINNAMSVMSVLDGTPQRFILTEEASKALSSFLQSYDTDENPATVTITVKNDGKSDTMISGKSANVVMMDALGKLGPHFGSLVVPQ